MTQNKKVLTKVKYERGPQINLEFIYKTCIYSYMF